MRYLPALVILPVLMCSVGCGDYRESMMAAPDRQGHAAGDPTKLGQDGGQLSNKPTPRKGEMWITMGNGDSLSSIAKAYGVTLDWLIKRNQLTSSPQPGISLIVPAQSKPAETRPPMPTDTKPRK